MNREFTDIETKVIQFLIEEKEELNNDINDIIYNNFSMDKEYKALTKNEMLQIEEIRRDIYEIYDIVDILNKRRSLND